jgi:hypothetical protein
MTQSQSVLNQLWTLVAVSLECTNDDEVILSLFPELFGFVSDLESEMDASMEEVFRLDLDCSRPLVPAFHWNTI